MPQTSPMSWAILSMMMCFSMKIKMVIFKNDPLNPFNSPQFFLYKKALFWLW